jgi:lysophospholipase L1-like esterase
VALGDSLTDAVVDFDRALRDPEYPTSILPIYDCGDHLHPSDRGYLQMGESIDLSLFD